MFLGKSKIAETLDFTGFVAKIMFPKISPKINVFGKIIRFWGFLHVFGNVFGKIKGGSK